MTASVPASPPGYDRPHPLPRPRLVLEAIGVLIFVLLGVGTGLHHRYLGLTDPAQLATIGGIIGLAVAHEVVHLVAARALGYQPSISLLPPQVYTEGEWGPRRHALGMLLAPFVGLNLLGIPMWFALTSTHLGLAGHVIVVINTAVSIADLYVAAYLLTLPAGSLTVVTRTDDGLREFVAIPQTASWEGPNR